VLGERGDFVKYVTDVVQKSAVNALSLPSDIRKTLKQVQRGDIELQVAGNKEKIDLLFILGKSLIYTLLLITTAVFAWLFYQQQELQLLKYAGGVGVFFGFLIYRNLRRGSQIKKSL